MAFHIGDTHFNHANIIKYCDRPFKDVNEMNEYIINKWNSVVSKKDIVYHHGDFAFNMTQEQAFDLVKRLNGKIILIQGNHDRKGIGWFKSCGFYEVSKEIIYKDRYILSHRPKQIDKIPEGFINIHGHVHNHGEDMGNKYMNVSCEVIEYTPIWI